MAFSTTPEMLCSNTFLPTTIEPSVLISKNGIGCGSLRNEDRERSLNSLYNVGMPSVSIFAQDPSPLRKVTASTKLSPFPSFNFLPPPKPQTESAIQPQSPFTDTGYFNNKSPFADDFAPSIPPPAPILEGELLPELLQCSVDQENFHSTFDLEQTKLIKSPPSVNTQPLAIESSLAELVDSDGGLLKLDMVPKFMELMSSETSPEGRSILITVMMASRPLFQKQFITEGGLAICDTWLNETKRIIPLILKLLLKLPVDLDSLQSSKKSGKIGKTIRKLAVSSSQDPKVQKIAKKLFDNWKKTVERASQPKKRPIQEPAAGEPPKKKPKTNGINTSKAFGASKPFESASPSATSVVKKDSLLNRQKTQAPRTVQVISPTTTPVKLGVSAPFDSKASSNQQGSSTIIVKKHSEAPLSADDIKKQKQQRKIKDSRKRTLNENSSASAASDNARNTPLSSPTQDLQSPPSKSSDNQETASNPPKKKKSVSWARDSEIAKIKYFPRDKTLGWRGPNNNLPPSNPSNAKPQQGPAPAAAAPRAPSYPFKPAISWYIPHRLDLPPSIKVGWGEHSKEKFVQEYREKDIPPSIYANGQIPPSPIECEEPQVEVNDNNLPLIPLEDMTREPSVPDQHVPVVNAPVNYNPAPVVQQAPHQSPPTVNSLAPAVLQLLTNQGGLQQVLSLLAGNTQAQMQPQYAPAGYSQPAYQQYPPNVQYNYQNYPVQTQPSYENMSMSQVANIPAANQQYYRPRY